MSETVQRLHKVTSGGSPATTACPAPATGAALARLAPNEQPLEQADTIKISKKRAGAPPVGPKHPWSNDFPLRGARNAHRTNTQAEMKEARQSKVHWLEGDLHASDPSLKMGHDASENGMPLQDWLKQGKASGRGLKLELKGVQSQADVERVLREVARANSDGALNDRMMFNLPSGNAAKYGEMIAEHFPNSILAITLPQGEISKSQSERVRHIMDDWKTRPKGVTFVLNETQAHPGLVQDLQRVGPVSIWNDVGVDVLHEDGQGSLDGRRRRLEKMGVQGVIDIQPDKNFVNVMVEQIGSFLGL